MVHDGLYNNIIFICTDRMSKVAMEASKKPIRPDVRNLVLEICCTDESGEDAEVPYIKYNFR